MVLLESLMKPSCGREPEERRAHRVLYIKGIWCVGSAEAVHATGGRQPGPCVVWHLTLRRAWRVC